MNLAAILRRVLRSFLGRLLRISLSGDEKSLSEKRVLIVANHQSILDELLLSLYLPCQPLFVLHGNAINCPFHRFLLSMVDHLVIDPAHPMAIKQVIRIVETGRVVVMFPEGRITTTGGIMKIYEGSGFVALKAGALVVPVYIRGLAFSIFGNLPKGSPRKFFPQVSLSILPSVQITMVGQITARERHRLATLKIQQLLQEMMIAVSPDSNLYGALLDAVALYGRRRRVIEDMREIMTYGQVLRMALGMGRMVSQRTGRSEIVGIMLPNLAVTLALFFGLGAVGRVPAMLNYTAGSQALSSACELATIRTIVTSRDFIASLGLEKFFAGIKGINILYLEDMKEKFSFQDRLWLVFFSIFPRLLSSDILSDDDAVVLFTSGSESLPKGVVLSHRAILANINQVQAVLEFSCNDKVFNALPVFHSFGLTVGALLPIISGVKCYLYPSPLHYRRIPEAIYVRDCTVLFGTSTFLGHYAKFAHSYDFIRLRYVIAGAEKLSSAVREIWIEKFGIRILEGYGATETAPVLSVNTPMSNRFGTVGRLLPGIQVKLVPVPDIQDGGVLHVKGPNVMTGYYHHDHPGEVKPTSSLLGPGWYDTGDVASLDEEGFLTIRGRVRRFAKVAGEMVSLEAVERLARKVSIEFQHAVISRTDSRRGELIVLYTTDFSLDRDRLLKAARHEGLTEIFIPRLIAYVEQIPILGTGKTDYESLKQLEIRS